MKILKLWFTVQNIYTGIFHLDMYVWHWKIDKGKERGMFELGK